MQKLCVSMALCTASGLAFAQAGTSVTLYGTVDGGMQYQSIKIPNIGSQSRTGAHSGGQTGDRWGLRGSEDLGDGWRALFTLEAGYTLQTGQHADTQRTAFNRQAFLGLGSKDWGTLTLGRQYGQGFLYFSGIGPFGNGFGLGSQSVAFGSSLVRYDGMAKYETPNIGGFTGAIGYSNEAGFGAGTAWDDTSATALAIGLRYAGGPLSAIATFDRLARVQTPANDGTGTLKAWIVGAAYDFEILKLSLAYGQDIDGRIAAGNTLLGSLGAALPAPNGRYLEGFKAHNYLVGATVPVGRAGKLLGAWSASDSNLDVPAPGGNGIATQHGFSLGYTYELSRRTNLYAIGTYLRNAAYIDDARSQEYRVGLLHRF